MNCVNHPDLPAIAYCRSCGKPLCEACRVSAGGTVYCQEHAPVAASAAATESSPYTAPAPATVSARGPIPDGGASPGLAFLLGLIPGVGAIYNGQYVKGLLHVVVLGILISIVSSSEASGGLEPLFGMMIGVWVFYMAFEAYHTARKRQLGQTVDEFSSLVPLHGQHSSFPVGPAVLIAVGLLFLLNNMEIIRFSQIIRYWPIALIALGVYMLYERMSSSEHRHSAPSGVQEATHERH
ncbi:MAG TPA: B-box zinc finger protein [Bryobacteraceae bacterium]|nr:B-box zinc finger protein [Bryobacteraceae bacterium]